MKRKGGSTAVPSWTLDQGCPARQSHAVVLIRVCQLPNALNSSAVPTCSSTFVPGGTWLQPLIIFDTALRQVPPGPGYAP
jgi:hypothetical protein